MEERKKRMIKSYIRRSSATRSHGASDLDQSISSEEGKSVLRNPLNFCDKSQTKMKLTENTYIILNNEKSKNKFSKSPYNNQVKHFS